MTNEKNIFVAVTLMFDEFILESKLRIVPNMNAFPLGDTSIITMGWMDGHSYNMKTWCLYGCGRQCGIKTITGYGLFNLTCVFFFLYVSISYE